MTTPAANPTNDVWDAYDLSRPHHDYIGTYDGSVEAIAEQLEADGYVGDGGACRREGRGWIIDETVALMPAAEG